MYYVNCLFIITNKYSIIVVSALYLVLNYNVYKLDCSILLIPQPVTTGVIVSIDVIMY